MAPTPNAFWLGGRQRHERRRRLPPTAPRRRPQPDRRHRPLCRRRDPSPNGCRVKRPQGGCRRRRRLPLAPRGPRAHRRQQIGGDPYLARHHRGDDAVRQPGAATEPEVPGRPYLAPTCLLHLRRARPRQRPRAHPRLLRDRQASRRRSGKSPAPRTPAASMPTRVSTSNASSPSSTTRSYSRDDEPRYPTREHERAATEITAFFKAQRDTQAVLLTNSCARGKAAPDSCLDMQVLTRPECVQELEQAWDRFAAGIPAVAELNDAGRWTDIHLDVTDGVFEVTIDQARLARSQDREPARLLDRSVGAWRSHA